MKTVVVAGDSQKNTQVRATTDVESSRKHCIPQFQLHQQHMGWLILGPKLHPLPHVHGPVDHICIPLLTQPRCGSSAKW